MVVKIFTNIINPKNVVGVEIWGMLLMTSDKWKIITLDWDKFAWNKAYEIIKFIMKDRTDIKKIKYDSKFIYIEEIYLKMKFLQRLLSQPKWKVPQ